MEDERLRSRDEVVVGKACHRGGLSVRYEACAPEAHPGIEWEERKEGCRFPFRFPVSVSKHETARDTPPCDWAMRVSCACRFFIHCLNLKVT